LCLAVEESSNGDLVATDFFGNGFEGEVLLLLGLEEGWGGCGETGDD
jgi:hypothetical protein